MGGEAPSRVGTTKNPSRGFRRWKLVSRTLSRPRSSSGSAQRSEGEPPHSESCRITCGQSPARKARKLAGRTARIRGPRPLLRVRCEVRRNNCTPMPGHTEQVDPAALQSARLRGGETLVNAWPTMGVGERGYIVLSTDQRFVLIDVQKAGFRKRTYVLVESRDPETIAEPTVAGDSWDDQELYVAGPGLSWFSTSIPAVPDEIALARSRRMRQLGLSERPTGAPAIREREVVTREIVNVPCHFCGALVDQTAQRCLSCGAPLGKS